MTNRTISRRRFIEGSIKGSLAVSLESKFGVLRGSTSEMPLGSDGSSFDGLGLRVAGDSQQGYSVTLVFKGQPLAQHSQGAEFSAFFQNEDRSVEDRVDSWRATSWSGNSTHVVLDGECRLKNLNTIVFAHVDYELVTPQVVRKRIRLQQDDMFMLFYQLSNRLEAVESPAKFWSFDQLDWQRRTVA